MRRKRSATYRAGATARGPSGPTIETPETIPGLKAWFDVRDPIYFALGAGDTVSAWLSRAGTIGGGLAWQQAVAASQPVRLSSDPLFAGAPSVSFDGVNDSLLTTNSAAWKFLHDGTGQSAFRVYWMDPTGPGVQQFVANSNAVTQSGVQQSVNTSSVALTINKGVTPAANALSGVNQTPKGVARWHMTAHGANVQYSRTSVSGVSQLDTSGPLSALNPSATLRMGAASAGSSLFLKGRVVQDIYYDHALIPSEWAALGAWAAATFGVAP